jgi:ABC-type glycerol-3-phosphate transport system substrate-binding protein
MKRFLGSVLIVIVFVLTLAVCSGVAPTQFDGRPECKVDSFECVQ